MLKEFEKIEDNGGRCVYYVWKNEERINYVDFHNYNSAVEFAKENDAHEVELAIWYSEDDYNDHLCADDFETVWESWRDA